GRAGGHGRPGITHELYSHVTRRIVPDFARWSRAEPAVERSVRQRVYDALESPGPHDGGPSPGCRRLRTAWRSGKHGQHADDDGAESRHGRPGDGLLRDASAVGPLGALALPAPAAVRRSPGAPAFRSAAAAACSLRLRALQAGGRA